MAGRRGVGVKRVFGRIAPINRTTITEITTRYPRSTLVDAAVGCFLAVAAVLLAGPLFERIDDFVVATLALLAAGYNAYRVQMDRTEHPDVLRLGGVLGLWLLAFSLSRDHRPLSLLTVVSLFGGGALIVVNALSYWSQFTNEPTRRARARQDRVRLRTILKSITHSSGGSLPEPLSRRFTLPLLLAVPVGVGAGLGAAAFRFLMFGVHVVLFGTLLPLLPSHLWIALLPMLGAAVAGLLIFQFAPEAAGHGVPENMEAIAKSGGRIRHRLAPFKVIVSALTLGAGGSGGREGPIARIGAGVGSSLGQICNLSEENTRLLLAAGIAGGIGATFGALLGGIFFAAEIVMVYRVTAYNLLVLAVTTLAAVTTAHLIAPHFTWFAFLPFPLPELSVTPMDVAAAAPYGLVLGLLAAAWVIVLERTEEVVSDVSIRDHVKPAIGALPVGILGIFFAKYGVMGVGYSGLRFAVSDHVALGAGLLLTLAVAKLVATQFTIGSGGSGGVFAPTLYIGGLFAVGLHQMAGVLPVGTALLGVVGMGAIFSGAAFAPLTSMFLVAEVFDSYTLVAVLAVPCLLSWLVSRRLLRASIYTGRLDRRGLLDDYAEKAASIGPSLHEDSDQGDHVPTSVSGQSAHPTD